MAKAAKKGARRSPHTKKQGEALALLEHTARGLGLKISVSNGQLHFAGLKLRGGSCLLRGKKWLILDKNRPFDELMDIYRQVITAEDIFSAGFSADILATVSPYFLTDSRESAA